jgi:mercuric reductase
MNSIVKLDISGMTCQSCEDHVKTALEEIEGMTAVNSISWKNKEAVVHSANTISEKVFADAIISAGYQFKGSTILHDEISNRRIGEFDIAVIGGGSAGFSAAIRAADLDKKVVVIEQGTIGGTCVNVGCVPSKFIISEAFAGKSWPDIKKDQENLISSLRKEKYEDIIKGYQDSITYLQDSARFIDEKTLLLGGGDRLTAGSYIIATGSRPYFPEIPGLDEARVLDSTGLLFIEKLPRSMIVVGGRFIALELAQAFARLGVQVTILQRSHRLIPQYDGRISVAIENIFRQQGIDIQTNTTLLEAGMRKHKKFITIHTGDEKKTLFTDEILMATGRLGNTESLGLQAAGLETGPDGFITVDQTLRSSVAGIFAAGDVTGNAGLVYVAAKEGQTAAQNISGDDDVFLSYQAVPEVIFTHPQIARVGISLEEASTAGVKTESSLFDISDTPYGKAHRDDTGVIKLIRDAETDRLIGAEILAKDAGNLIQVLTIAIQAGFTISQFTNTYFPYLTAGEGAKLAAITFDKDVSKLSCCAG